MHGLPLPRPLRPREGPEETGHGERDEQGEITGQGEGEEGKEKRDRIIVVVRRPPQENYPADAHPSALKSVLESANPAWTRSAHLDAPGQRHGQQPISGTADPGVVKQDKSSRGSVDTTKTRSDPHRVRMSSGERPIGTGKGKQPNTEALCHPPPPPRPDGPLVFRAPRIIWVLLSSAEEHITLARVLPTLSILRLQFCFVNLRAWGTWVACKRRCRRRCGRFPSSDVKLVLEQGIGSNGFCAILPTAVLQPQNLLSDGALDARKRGGQGLY